MSPFLFFFILGIALISVELLILQFSVFWVAFLGLGALLAALILIVAPGLGWAGGSVLFVVASVTMTLLLMKPLRKWQKAKSPIAGNDAIGQSVEILEAVSADKPGKAKWSGVDWHAELDGEEEQAFEAGQHATIKRLSGLTLYIGR